MSIHISRAAQYGLRALAYMATLPRDQAVAVRDLAEREKIPQHFLSKIARVLVEGGIIEAFRGPGGGVRLARRPRDITVLEVLRCIDGRSFSGCVLGLNKCSDDAPCAMHDEWKSIRGRMEQRLDKLTIARLGAKHDELG